MEVDDCGPEMDAVVDRFVVAAKHERRQGGDRATLLVGDGLMQIRC